MKKEHHFLADLVLDILQTTICLQRHQKAFQNNKASKQQSHVARYFIKPSFSEKRTKIISNVTFWDFLSEMSHQSHKTVMIFSANHNGKGKFPKRSILYQMF